MGLKGYKLWAMGHLDSNVQSPTRVVATRSDCMGASAASSDSPNASTV
jgi:hypothetical protein